MTFIHANTNKSKREDNGQPFILSTKVIKFLEITMTEKSLTAVY